MYWPVGVPSVFQAKSAPLTGLEYASMALEEKILALRRLYNGSHFIVLTSRRIYIWQSRPTVVVSCITRTAISLTLYGENKDVFVKQDSQFAVVKTSLGFLFIYSIYGNTSQKLYKFHYSHSKLSVFDFLDSYRSTEYDFLYPKFKTMIKVDSGLLCILALDEFLLFSTVNPPSIQSFFWYKESNHTVTSDPIAEMDWIEDQNVAINDMIYEKNMDIYIWISLNSKAYFVRRNSYIKSKNQGSVKNWTGICFYIPETEEEYIVKADINMHLSLIAFGCKNGKVKLFHYKKIKNLITHLHTIVLDSFHITGNIECMAWSEDGNVFFVGFRNTWALWSAYGCLLSSALIAEHTFEGFTEEIYMTGISHVLWLNEGNDLIIISNGEKSFGKLWKLNIARAIPYSSFSSKNSINSILQISDRLLVYKGYEKSDIDLINPEECHWQQIRIPLDYFRNNCYIKYSAITSCGQYLVIAGYHGIAYYSFVSEKWRIITKDSNSNFQVSGGMCWYHNVLIASIQINNIYELKLFSRKSTIDDIRILSAINMSIPVCSITLISENLLVYTQDNSVLQYLIIVNNKKVKLVFVGSISLKDIVYSSKSLRAFTWCFLTDQAQGTFINNIHIANIIILLDDKLMFLKPNKNSDLSMKYHVYLFSEKVEHFLFVNHSSQYIKPSIWAFCGTEIKIWMDFSNTIIEDINTLGNQEILPNLNNDDNLITISLDFYPIFLLLNKGIILGIKNGITWQKNLDYFDFKINTIAKPVLPYILEKYLYRTRIEESVILASKYQSIVYFNHMLELLLHNVLEKEISFSKESNDLLLPRVVSFLKCFSQMLDIVVACARKMEVSFWEYFFSVVGSPRDLFEDCMKLGKLETAAEYLIILHTIEASNNLSKDIIRVLENALQFKKWKLCMELFRFFVLYNNDELALKTFTLTLDIFKNMPLEIKE
ncbi:hypothetical protein PMAC_003066 [Pneumocystis sp. 'macacae']|nr:hypothetical protein PMAC_003066 [Pneumocystis sp. 'macacae']